MATCPCKPPNAARNSQGAGDRSLSRQRRPNGLTKPPTDRLGQGEQPEINYAALQSVGRLAGPTPPPACLAGVGRSRSDGWRCCRARQPFHRQLQRRPGTYRKGARHSPLADDPGHRLCRHRRVVLASQYHGWRSGDPQRLGRGRDAFRRLCPDGPRAGKLAREDAGPVHPSPVHGDRHGVKPSSGPVLVTGAAGGVGSVAIALLARLGYQLSAATGRTAEADYLKGLGASEIVDRAELAKPARPLAKERWAGAVDAVGSQTLANVLSMTQYGGAVAACGLAGGMDLPTSVAPFILRGVTLVGIDSVMAPMPLRVEAWDRLARDLDLGKLAAMSLTRPAGDVVALAPQILAGQVR